MALARRGCHSNSPTLPISMVPAAKGSSPVGENEKTKVSKNKSIEIVGGKPNNAQNTKKVSGTLSECID